MQKMKPATLILFLAAWVLFGNVTQAAQRKLAKGGDYLGIVKAYAGAMIKNGRDTYGTKHSPLFASALDRRTMRIGTFEDIPGVRIGDRTLGGANPQEETDLYAILYRLTELSGDKRYANEADRSLEFFFSHCQSPLTGLMTWGEHLYWDFEREAMGGNDFAHEIKGEWPFWDECYRLAPEACWKFAIGQWDHQIADKKTGDFSRHANWSSHGPQTGADFPRYAGQMIANWTDAYIRKENRYMSRRPELVTAISLMVARMEGNMKTPTGYLLAGTDESHGQISWPTHNLELARCLWNSAPHMPGKLAERMRKLALKQDIDFHRMPHAIDSGGGFVATIDVISGEPRSRSMNRPYTTTWTSNYGQGIHAGRANRCFSRFEQIEKSHPALAGKHKQLILSAAKVYLTATPDTNVLVKPGTIASVITLMLNTHSLTGEKKYLDRADYFGQLGVKLFLGDGLPLPKATNQHYHYETITGGPGFMHALLKLHEALNKAVFSVRDFGAKGDGKTLDTRAIQEAMDACGKAGGGIVRIPKGTYLSGAVFMKSKTTLVIEEGATVLGSTDESGDYPIIDSRFNGTEQKCHASLINAIDAHDITITGKGVVAGSGIGGSRPPTGPRVIEFIRCKNVLLENIKVTNKGRWTIHPLYCTDVIIRGLDIETTGQNSDGIDPDSCDRMLITECTFKTGDDCIAIKSGKNQNGIDVGIPCQNITITNCTMLGGYGAVCIGSEMSGGIRNILIKDCVIRNNGTGFNIKSRKGRGGVVENIEFSNIKMYNVNSPIVIQMNYRFNAGDLIPGPAGIPTFRNITIKDLTNDGNRMGAIHGIGESPISGLTLKNIKCGGNGSLSVNYIKGLTFDNIQNDNGGIALIMNNTELKK